MNTISVVIATKDRPKELLACLKSVLAQAPRPLEVVIMDQSRTAQGELLGKLFELNSIRLHYVHDPNLSGAAQARNRAIGFTSGTLLLFLDDDVELAPSYVREILSIFDADRGRRVGGTGGLIVNLPATLSSAQRLRSWLFYRGPFSVERDALAFHFGRGDRPRRALRLHGCNMTLRRQVLNDVQFDEAYTGYSFGEDRDLSVQIAGRFELLWVPHARLIHKQTSTTRIKRERFCELRVLSWLRFYGRCVPKNLYTLLCYVWLNVGFLVLLLGVWDSATVRGTYRGLRRLVQILLRKADLREALREGWRPEPS